MKYSMRTKVFALCLFLVVVTVGSLSTTSYYTTKKLIHDSVEKRIQVAFDIILNDLFYQIENFPRQIDEFLKQDNSLKRALYVYGKTPEKIGSILYVTGHLIRATNELKKVGNVVSINRLGLYSKDGRLLVFHGNFEKGQHMGAHVKSFNGKDTFLPLNDRSAMAEILYGSQPIPNNPLPEGTAPFLEFKELPDQQVTEMFSRDKKVGLKILTPVKYIDETVGILIAEVNYTKQMIERYARLSKTHVNFFCKSELSQGTLPLQSKINSITLKSAISASELNKGKATVPVSSVRIGEEDFYQGRVSFWNSTRFIGGITVNLSRSILDQKKRSFFITGIVISSIIGAFAFFLSVLFTRKSINAIQRLTESASIMANGDLEQEIAPQTTDELGILANSFSSMRDSVKDNIRRLERLTTIIETTSDIIAIAKPDGQITYLNKTGMVFFQWDNIDNKTTKNIHPHRIRKLIIDTAIPKTIEDGIWEQETVILGPDGQEVPVHQIIMAHKNDQEELGYFSSIIRDLTEQKKTQEILIQNEKMLSIGGLAAGMAHEINNPLAGVIQNASVLENRLTNPDIPANIKIAESLGTNMETIRNFMEARDIFKMLNAISDSGSRMASIVGNMLSFARKGDSSFSSHRMEELMDKTLELAGTDYDLKKQYDFKSIRIEKMYEDSLPLILCEASKIQQVLLNILNNGAHAMFDRQTTDKNYQPQFTLRLSHDKKRSMLQIEIEDNGSGMDEETRKNIFQPFFTTKPVGEGTGLGLSVSYFIVSENHKGTIDVLSAPGKGTTFIINLPVSINEHQR